MQKAFVQRSTDSATSSMSQSERASEGQPAAQEVADCDHELCDHVTPMRRHANFFMPIWLGKLAGKLEVGAKLTEPSFPDTLTSTREVRALLASRSGHPSLKAPAWGYNGTAGGTPCWYHVWWWQEAPCANNQLRLRPCLPIGLIFAAGLLGHCLFITLFCFNTSWFLRGLHRRRAPPLAGAVDSGQQTALNLSSPHWAISSLPQPGFSPTRPMWFLWES